jgi:hypothetical protein
MNLTKLGRRIAAVVVAGSALAVPIPIANAGVPAAPAPGSGMAMARCTATGATSGGGMQIVLSVHAVEPEAATMYVACGIVQSGLDVYVSAIGSVAGANAGTGSIAFGPYSVCQDHHIVYRDGTVSHYEGCP